MFGQPTLPLNATLPPIRLLPLLLPPTLAPVYTSTRRPPSAHPHLGRQLSCADPSLQAVFKPFFKYGMICLNGDMWRKHVRVLGPMVSPA